jgi:DNA-binding HxlR family transcriptional regulator
VSTDDELASAAARTGQMAQDGTSADHRTAGEETAATALKLLAADTFERDCPTRRVMDQVTTRWSTLIVAALVSGPHRFNALQRRVAGISQKMLSQHLKELVRAGLIRRDIEPTVPPQVTYSLTPLGQDLAGPLCSLIHWIGAHSGDLLQAQARYDTRQPGNGRPKLVAAAPAAL